MDWAVIAAWAGVVLVIVGGLWKIASLIAENTTITKQILQQQRAHTSRLITAENALSKHSVSIGRLEEGHKFHDVRINELAAQKVAGK